MRSRGRRMEPLTDAMITAVEYYLHSDDSIVQVAEKYGINRGTLQYNVAKYRKMSERGKI
jgi:transposase-like protein